MMMNAVSKLGSVVTLTVTLLLAASPSVASSTVTTPRTVSTTSPCQSGPITIPATHVPSSGLVEVDLGTHQRFDPLRALPLDNPQAATMAGGDLYVSYSPAAKEARLQVARIDPKTGVVARSPKLPGYYSNTPVAPVVAFGSVWIVAGGFCKQEIVRMDQATLAVTMTTPIPENLNFLDMVASDGALWLPSGNSASLVRLDARTGHISTVLLPEMVPNSQVFGFASDPRSGLIYISVVNQNAAHSQVTERFDPATASFYVVPPPEGWLYSVRGVAGGVLWVAEGPGNMSHYAAFSARSLTPLSCTQVETCALGGIGGTVVASFEDGTLAFEQAGSPPNAPGYWMLDCIAGPRASTVDRLQLPSDFKASGVSPLPPPLLTIGDGYLVTVARVGTYGGSGVAIFPLDPRCAP